MGNKEIHDRHGNAGSSDNAFQNYFAFILLLRVVLYLRTLKTHHPD